MFHCLYLSANNISKLLVPVLSEHDKAEKAIIQIAEKANVSLDTNIDFKRVLGEYKKAFPWYLQRFIDKSFERGFMDQNYGYKRAIKVYTRQGFYALFQFMFLIAFILIVAFSLKAV